MIYFCKTHKICIVLLFMIIVMITPVSASLQITGTVKYMENLAPGTTITFPIHLSIGSNDPTGDYSITAFGFGNDKNGNYVTIKPESDTGAQTARPYITVDKPVVSMKPGVQETVTVTVVVPASATGGLYALINIQPSQGKGMVRTATNVPVMITLTGTPITETGIINSLIIDNTVSPALVTTTFTNTGNHHYYGAQNKIVITNAAGGEIGTFATKPLVTTIVPGGTVNFTQTINIPLTSDIYTVKSTVVTDAGRDLDVKINQFTATGDNKGIQTNNPLVTTTPLSGWNLALLLVVMGVVGIIIGIILLRRSG